jgi:hypothetical protein
MFRAGAAIWGAGIRGAAMCGGGAAMRGAAMCGAGAAMRGGADICGMAGAARGIAGAGRAAAAAGGPPPRPPWGGSATTAVVERARMETAAIAARRKCNDITKLRNETFKLKCAQVPPRSGLRLREIAADSGPMARIQPPAFRSRNRHRPSPPGGKVRAGIAGINIALLQSRRRYPIRGPMERAR